MLARGERRGQLTRRRTRSFGTSVRGAGIERIACGLIAYHSDNYAAPDLIRLQKTGTYGLKNPA